MSTSSRNRYFRGQLARRRGPQKPPKAAVKVRGKAHALSPQEYRAYMRSTEWATRKAAYFQTHVRECIICGTTEKVQVHHLSYERLGRELDDDLRPLCELHHAAAHEHHKQFGGTIRVATLRFIQRMHDG